MTPRLVEFLMQFSSGGRPPLNHAGAPCGAAASTPILPPPAAPAPPPPEPTGDIEPADSPEKVGYICKVEHWQGTWPDGLIVYVPCGCVIRYNVQGRFLVENTAEMEPCATEECNTDWGKGMQCAYLFLESLK